MSCTRVLQALSSCPPSAAATVDFAMSLSRRRPVPRLTSRAPPKASVRHYQPMDRLLSTGAQSHHQRPSSPRSCFRRDNTGLNKKRVVFADTRGLALTAVRLFIPDTHGPVSTLLQQPSMFRLPRTTEVASTQRKYKLRLGFSEPAADISSFLARLRETNVQLESCSLSEHLLSGRVRVSHTSPEKIVNLQVTFDSWRSHHDIPCAFLYHERCGATGSDVFTFDVSLPQDVDPSEKIEFRVSYKPGPDAPIVHWDDNRGQNYGVHVDSIAPSDYQFSMLAKQTPSWQPHVSADMLYLPRFSSRLEGLYAAKYTI